MFINDTNDYSKIKLIDFGLSSYTLEINKYNCGTPFYQSPETLRNECCGLVQFNLIYKFILSQLIYEALELFYICC